MIPKPMTFKLKKRVKSSGNRYLKPGALSRLRYNLSATRCCTDIGKKRVVLDSKEENRMGQKRILLDSDKDNMNKIPLDIATGRTTSSPTSMEFGSPSGLVNESKQLMFRGTPRTSSFNYECQSRLESLPIELLVKIICQLHHDQLKAVFHVSRRICSAVIIARQTYFNFTTPDRSRQEMLNIKTPLPTERWPFTSRGEGKAIRFASPHTPRAPRHGPRPPRLHLLDMKQVAAVLFQDSALPSKCVMLPGLPRPILKPLASNRVLFYEDELCQAVAQNKLR
ncbi:F-box protein [Apostasia shenzhenica]|uniref:F-box protein n=1 Tax=Apostasia shenzhenica TaxID=1088818 RepID=A0A2I0AKD1_9ASPA|nr:F-box protein [Apostasia shenzhenica]